MEPSVLSDEDVFDKLEELLGEVALFSRLPFEKIPYGAVLMDLIDLSARRTEFYLLIRDTSPSQPGDLALGQRWIARRADVLLEPVSDKVRTPPTLFYAPYGMHVLAIPKEVVDALHEGSSG